MIYSAGHLLIRPMAVTAVIVIAVAGLDAAWGSDLRGDRTSALLEIESYLTQTRSSGTALVWVDLTAKSTCCEFVDNAGAQFLLPKQLMPSADRVASQKPLPGNNQLRLVLSSSLKESLAAFSSSLGGFLEKAARDEAANPIACYDAALVSNRLRPSLTDLKSNCVDLTQNRGKKPRVLVAGEASKPHDGAFAINVSRILIISPPTQQHAARYREGRGLKAMALDADGSKSAVDFYDISLLGDDVFLEACGSTEFFGRLLRPDGISEYRGTVLAGDLKEVADWNAGIQKDIVALTSEAQDAALARADIKKDLAANLEKRQADQIASFLGERQGPAFVSSLAEVLQGHHEPLEQLLRCDRQRAALYKRLSPEGIDWFFGQRMARVGVIAVDSNKLWLVQFGAAVAVVDRMCTTLLPVAGDRLELSEEKIKQLTSKLRDAGRSGLTENAYREFSTMIETASINGWEDTPVGRSLLPEQPRMPSPPTTQVGGRTLGQATERLQRRADIAQANGDQDGFLEAQEAIGAAAAEATGNSQLMNQFSESAKARARLYSGSPPSYVVHTSDPGYQKALADYRQQMSNWNVKKDELNKKLTAECNAKKKSVLQQLRFVWQVDQALVGQAELPEGEAIFFVPNLEMYAR